MKIEDIGIFFIGKVEDCMDKHYNVINRCALLDQDTGSILLFVHSLAWFFNCKTNKGRI